MSNQAQRRAARRTRFVARAAVIVAVTVGSTAAASVGFAASAHQKAVQIPTTGWYAKDTVSQVGLPADPTAGQEPTNVPAGDLPVGADLRDQATRESYIGFDLSELADGATVTSLRLTMRLDDASKQQGGDSHPLLACIPKSAFDSGPGHDWSDKPADDCTQTVESKYDAKHRSYRFDLTPIASALQDGTAAGVGIAPAAPTQPVQQPWQLAFKGRSHLQALISYSVATVSHPSGGSTSGGTGDTGTATSNPSANDTSGTSSGGTTGGSDSGSSGITLPPVTSLPTTQDQSSGGSGPAPVVAGPGGTSNGSTGSQAAQVAPAALSIPNVNGTPVGFLIAILAGLISLSLLGVLMAEQDLVGPVVARARRGRPSASG